jgi:glycosyltransferase involved in cell wall biosynthesis
VHVRRSYQGRNENILEPNRGPRRIMQYRIPKRIIQTGKQADQPLRNRAMVSNIRLLHPDYEYLFFDDQAVETFIDREFPHYRVVFDSFPFPIQRYDFFRYLAVYRYGGFYLDLDVLLASGLSDLLEFGCVFPFEGLTFSHLLRTRHKMDWQIGNYAFGAAPEHPFLEAIIKNCLKAQKDPDWVKPMMRGFPALSRDEFFVLNTTGPGLVSRTLAENPELTRTITVLFPDDVCDVRNWNRFGELGVHLMEGSWRARGSFLRRRLSIYWEDRKLQRLLRQSTRLGKTRNHIPKSDFTVTARRRSSRDVQDPLVSILIPAFNAQEWIADTLRSAVAQTWRRKEIIVVDDGSTDETLAIARQFESECVRIVTQKNQGGSAARNAAFSLSQGDYIQWLDADDLLASDKIAMQMEMLDKCKSKRTLLSSEWGRFMYRYYRAQFTPTDLWCDLPPIEWLLRKMGQNIYMQTATWLVSRELAEAAGPWDTRLLADDDGEYFCRVLLASNGVRFVPGARVYYRTFGYDSLSYIGGSDIKCEAHWLSMRLHIQYLRSLEDSERVRRASLRYLRNCLIYFYPEKSHIVRDATQLAMDLGEQLGSPSLSWKYSWVKAMFGWDLAKRFQVSMRRTRWQVEKVVDKILFQIDKPRLAAQPGLGANVDPISVGAASDRYR